MASSIIIVAMFLPLGPYHAPEIFVVQFSIKGMAILREMTPRVGELVYANHNPNVDKALET